MKDTFNGSNASDKINHFTFECEIFDKTEKLLNSREIQVEITNFEITLPELNLY